MGTARCGRTRSGGLTSAAAVAGAAAGADRRAAPTSTDELAAPKKGGGGTKKWEAGQGKEEQQIASRGQSRGQRAGGCEREQGRALPGHTASSAAPKLWRVGWASAALWIRTKRLAAAAAAVRLGLRTPGLSMGLRMPSSDAVCGRTKRRRGARSRFGRTTRCPLATVWLSDASSSRHSMSTPRELPASSASRGTARTCTGVKRGEVHGKNTTCGYLRRNERLSHGIGSRSRASCGRRRTLDLDA